MSFMTSGEWFNSELLRALFKEPLLDASDPLLDGPREPLLELDDSVPTDKLQKNTRVD